MLFSEHQYFIVNEELTDVKAQYTEVATQNSQLQAQILSNGGCFWDFVD